MKQTILFVILMLTAMTAASAQESHDRGFIHPGGLYTQADFDRVKAMITARNQKVVLAYTKLKNAEYAQASV